MPPASVTTSTLCGRLPDGLPVYAWTLAGTGGLTLEALKYGGNVTVFVTYTITTDDTFVIDSGLSTDRPTPDASAELSLSSTNITAASTFSRTPPGFAKPPAPLTPPPDVSFPSLQQRPACNSTPLPPLINPSPVNLASPKAPILPSAWNAKATPPALPPPPSAISSSVPVKPSATRPPTLSPPFLKLNLPPQNF